ncbi:hypothetical protein E2320_021245, partial [Naja naja]
LSPNASPVLLVEGQVTQQRPCPASSRAKAAVGPLDSIVVSVTQCIMQSQIRQLIYVWVSFINEMANDGQEEQRHFMVV